MFSWSRDVAQFAGGLLVLAIVGVLSAVSVAWDVVREVRRRR